MKFTLGENSLYRQSKFLWPSLKIWNFSGSIYKNRLIGGLGLGIRMILGSPCQNVHIPLMTCQFWAAVVEGHSQMLAPQWITSKIPSSKNLQKIFKHFAILIRKCKNRKKEKKRTKLATITTLPTGAVIKIFFVSLIILEWKF